VLSGRAIREDTPCWQSLELEVHTLAALNLCTGREAGVYEL